MRGLHEHGVQHPADVAIVMFARKLRQQMVFGEVTLLFMHDSHVVVNCNKQISGTCRERHALLKNYFTK